ncbi:non-specific lipid transfer protein GPI-anchored 14-like [Vigna umbellata]|uniref:non-specific lipid transfer protein GPI-anchored 14-like n=1 Tax=Vigna umbellata TaxID=87088 RepID=UPI001F5F9AF2|nr:non-specific lipid transfer protein GPI-anchored 14-like [Vigna umbellata]
MASTNLILSSTLLLLLVGFATSDINQDRADCTDKLVGLVGCLTYVSGEASAPTMDCCSGLKQVIDKSKRCLCVLIKDRDDPSLGLKINVTLALKLPEVCKTPTNITQCVDLLHLQPNSPDAKVFEGFDKAQTNKTSPSSGPAGSATGTPSSGANKKYGGWGKKWVVTEVVCGILPLVFVSNLVLLMV